MKEYTLDGFKTGYDVYMLLKRMFESDGRYPILITDEYLEFFIKGLKHESIQIIEYDFFDPYNIQLNNIKNVESLVEQMHFYGRRGEVITILRKKAIGMLANKKVTADGKALQIEDNINSFESNSIYIKSKNAIAICGNKELNSFFNIIKSAEQITNLFFLFPYNFYDKNEVIEDREVFYQIKITNEFRQLLKVYEEQQMRAISEKINDLNLF